MQTLLDFEEKKLTYEELRMHYLVEYTMLNDAWREIFVTSFPDELKAVITQNGLEGQITEDMIVMKPSQKDEHVTSMQNEKSVE